MGYDFSSVRNLVEVAGGRGTLIASILRANLSMEATLFDLPYVVEEARPLIEALGLLNRCHWWEETSLNQSPRGRRLPAEIYHSRLG
ncbi:hypothetical protein H6F93_09500 [Leptolyngbya sp. FACHB-671]|nr:hypothetical protein [Leptolyngbya sp. FACHB-671]